MMFVEREQGDSVTLRQPSHFSDTLKALSNFRNDGILCDIVLIVDGKRFPAHKNILASCSEYFKAMFTGSMSESRQSEVSLESISSDVFEQILDFIYSGNFSIDMISVLDILHASSMLAMKDMETECIQYLHKNMDSTNCFRIRNVGEAYMNQELVKYSDDFIYKNFEKLAEEKEILNLSLGDLRKLLSSDDIICKTEDVVSSIVEKWLVRRPLIALNDVNSLLKVVRSPYLSDTSLKKMVSVLKDLDSKSSTSATSKVSSSCSYVNLLINQQKIQSRKQRGNNISCRTCQINESVILCISLRGEVYCYHMASKRFRRLDRFPHFWQPSQLIVNDEVVYATGGAFQVAECIYTSEVYSFDPTDGKWSTLPRMSHRRGRHCASFLDGKLYVMGGRDERISSELSLSVECYDLASKTWTSKAPMEHPRIDASAVSDGRYIYVIGGTFLSDSTEILKSVERYNPRKNCWEKMPSLNEGRCGSSAVYTNDKIFVFGGSNSLVELYNFEYLEPHKNKWTLQVIPFDMPIHAALGINNKILVLGKSQWGEDIFLQYYFVRRHGIKSERLPEFIHSSHRTVNFRYAVTKMLNYEIDGKPEALCDCNDYDEHSSFEDDIITTSSDDDFGVDRWMDFRPFGMFL